MANNNITLASNVILCVEFYAYTEADNRMDWSGHETPKGIHIACQATYKGKKVYPQFGKGIFSTWWQKGLKKLPYNYKINLGRIPEDGIKDPQLGGSKNPSWWEHEPCFKGLMAYLKALENLLN